MSDYRKQSILRIIAVIGGFGSSIWLSLYPGKYPIIALVAIALLYLLLEIKFYFNLKTFLIALLFMLSIVVFTFTFLGFFIHSNKPYLQFITDISVAAKLPIIIVSWTVIWQLLIKRFGNINFILGFFRLDSERIDNWTAVTTANDQGTDIKEIELGDKLLTQIDFTVKSTSNYWRAGLKIADPNGQAVPLVDKKYGNILFHIGLDEGTKVGLTVYDSSSNFIPTKAGYLPGLNKDSEITISAKINDNNFLQCFVNNKLEYETRIDSGLRKKAYLLAWGDGRDYEVSFKNISYKK